MDNTWGPPTSPDPPRRRTEYGYLVLGSAALTGAVVLCAVDQLAAADFSRGLYSILAGLFVVGGCGWVVRSGDSQRRRDLCAGANELRADLAGSANQVAELAVQVRQLRDQIAGMRGYPTGQRAVGHMYLSQAATVGDTVPAMPRVERPAVDQAALRDHVEQLVVDELGNRDAARSQGFAEGYVAGLSRREEDPPVV